MFCGYSNVYTDKSVNFYSIAAQYLMTVCSLIVNLSLIYLIANGTRKDMGNYRVLLICFASNDVMYTVIHFLTYPIPETYSSTLIMRAHGPLNSKFFECLYIANYGTSFPLLAAHFAYRAFTLRWPQFPLYFRKFIAITIGATLLVAGCWFFLGYVCFAADEYSRAITRPLMEGLEWSPVVHTRDTEALYHIMCTYGASERGVPWRYYGGAAMLSVIMTLAYGSILASSSIVVGHVRANASSARSMQLQAQLFKCLVYQTLFPLVTSCAPAVLCTIAPIIGFSWPAISIVIPNFCALHPLFDGAVVMLTVTEYRRSLIRMLICTRNGAKELNTTTASLSLA